MFSIGETYSKNELYKIMNVPLERRKGAWDTGYRVWEGNIFIFSNVGIPGRTGHNYNNYWDGELFVWEAKTNSNINQPLIKKMLAPLPQQENYLFTRINDMDPFTFEGSVRAKEYKNNVPVVIVWELIDSEISNDVKELKTFPEGAVQQVFVNKYERNPLARRICIKHYGALCNICGFDFQKTYGDWGKNYIHVHHIVPLSVINQEYNLDPIEDLIPVCPNCHSMIHRKRETLSIVKLKEFIQR